MDTQFDIRQPLVGGWDFVRNSKNPYMEKAFLLMRPDGQLCSGCRFSEKDALALHGLLNQYVTACGNLANAEMEGLLTDDELFDRATALTLRDGEEVLRKVLKGFGASFIKLQDEKQRLEVILSTRNERIAELEEAMAGATIIANHAGSRIKELEAQIAKQEAAQ